MADKNQANTELSLVGAGTVIEGKVKAEGSIRVDGRIVGDLAVKANATVGAGGVVEGNIIARNISLAGKVVGTVAASEKLVLESKSVMQGDIRATRLVVDEGAAFDGRCTRAGAGTPPAKPEGRPAS